MTKAGMCKRLTALLVAAALVGLVGCGKRTAQADLLTMKPTEEGRTQITVLVKHAFTINAFEQAVEAHFPDIDLVQVGSFTTALAPEEYEARMKHDDLTDLVMTWPLPFGEQYWADRLLDLSAMPFTTRYNVSMLDTISRDGKLYYLPGPAQVRGIVYNKTLFEEKGWQVPSDFEGFLALCKTIEESGIRALQLGFANPEVLDTAFIGYSYADSFATPRDAQWIADYAEGQGRFLEHFGGALDTFQLMADAGIWRASDLTVDYSDREKSLFTRRCAMVEDSVLLTRSGQRVAGSTDEFALMPFFNPGGENNDWTRIYMVCYIGMNKHLAEPEQKQKYEKALALMDYISTPEGQEALAADTGTMYSSLKGMAPLSAPETTHLVSALEHGRYAIFPELTNVQGKLREGLAGMLTGELTKADVGRMMDEASAFATRTPVPPEMLGTAETSFSLIETGNFITDAMRAYSGCELAFFLDGGKDGRYNNKGVTAKIYAGDQSAADIRRIMPDFKYGERGELWKVTMTGADLLSTLEYAIPVDNNNTGWFYYFSGLKLQFDPFAAPGSRISRITLADGGQIDPAREYTIAVMEHSVPEAYQRSCEKTGVLIGDIVAESIRTQKTIRPSSDGRFVIG